MPVAPKAISITFVFRQAELARQNVIAAHQKKRHLPKSKYQYSHSRVKSLSYYYKAHRRRPYAEYDKTVLRRSSIRWLDYSFSLMAYDRQI